MQKYTFFVNCVERKCIIEEKNVFLQIYEGKEN